LINKQGHSAGPDSVEVNDSLKVLDDGFSFLINGLKTRSIYDVVNLVVVSDHGMAETDPLHKVIFISDYIDIKLIKVIDNAPMTFVYPHDSANTDSILQKLSDAALKNTHFQVWAKESAPPSYHYLHSDRIGPITILASLGWFVILDRKSYDPKAPPFNIGVHGYDPVYDEMHAVFIAHGPAFPPGPKWSDQRPFHNVDIYNMLTGALGINGKPNNGTII
jgi:predicted AlkP superfamily pyrophosphatase or phosphodiesterase